MTTGRINQVAFLSDAETRMNRPPDAPRRGFDRPIKTDKAVVQVKGQCVQLGRAEAETPRPHKAFRIREHGQDPVGHSGRASTHSTRGEHGARLESTPHLEWRKADGDTKSIKFLSRGKQHRIPQEPASQEPRLGQD